MRYSILIKQLQGPTFGRYGITEFRGWCRALPEAGKVFFAVPDVPTDRVTYMRTSVVVSVSNIEEDSAQGLLFETNNSQYRLEISRVEESTD